MNKINEQEVIMPIYEYECENCGQIEEAWQKISDNPLETCKSCQGHLHKIVSQSSFHLKGTGWYVTDYSGKKNTESKKTEDSKETKTEKTETKSSETKTAAKATSE
jgi:putative FmdB family regulatory protein